MKIFLDMDGVLMDFDRALIENGLFVWAKRKGNRTYHHLPQQEWTMEEKEHDDQINALMMQQTFWDNIKPMADAYLLWDYCRPFRAEVLSARPAHQPVRLAPMVIAAKERSIWRYFDGAFDPRYIHICLRKEKAQFAPGNILVDDLVGNCNEWNAAGGTAILHKDAASTVKILSELYHG